MEFTYTDKQLEILEIAEKLFAEFGFDGTSIRAISKEAQINVAMVSYYFGSKEKLLQNLLNYRIQNFRISIEDLFAEKLGPLEKMDRLIEIYVEGMYKNRCMYQIMSNEISSKKRTFDFSIFREVKTYNINLIHDIIEEGKAAGIVSKKCSPAALVHATLMGTFINFQMNQDLFRSLLNLPSSEAFANFNKNDLINHIQRTIKALLLYEN